MSRGPPDRHIPRLLLSLSSARSPDGRSVDGTEINRMPEGRANDSSTERRRSVRSRRRRNGKRESPRVRMCDTPGSRIVGGDIYIRHYYSPFR